MFLHNGLILLESITEVGITCPGKKHFHAVALACSDGLELLIKKNYRCVILNIKVSTLSILIGTQYYKVVYNELIYYSNGIRIDLT